MFHSQQKFGLSFFFLATLFLCSGFFFVYRYLSFREKIETVLKSEINKKITNELSEVEKQLISIKEAAANIAKQLTVRRASCSTKTTCSQSCFIGP